MTLGHIGRTLFATGVILSAAPAASAQVARSDCFPLERVAPALRSRAEALLLETMDGTALYTVAGLKPMTSGFLGPDHAIAFEAAALRPDAPLARRIDELRQMFTVLQCGDDIRSAVVTDILSVAGARGAIETYIFHMPAFRGVIAALPDYFAPLAITPHASPETVLFTMNRQQASAPRGNPEARRDWARANHVEIGDRTRATGLLFGYPKPAVESFAAMTVKAIRGELPPEQGAIGALAMRIPNFRGDEVWYRKPAAEDSAEDTAMRARAAQILAEYRTRRERYIGGGKPGIVALLRDWFCNGDTGCAAANATVK